ncbi:hypothetical protein B9Z55_025773 [Caenorhabditis nigoni]|uniref:T-box domain-containing protein n=1 Tax=Caenorhabditis nigoni TaxID=1611254 RepID=A0A2G5SZW4_9PELO|nr:hypothetical protein B9Z55_025773 [Caenorhabditis nigoni]
MSGIKVTLKNADLWTKFNSPMEMIVTRQNGRKMFPALEYSVSGLDPTAMYEVYLHMERIDNHKYRYKNNGWDDYAKGDPITPIQKIKHKSGGQTGMFWMNGPISFEQVRLTNNPDLQKDDNIVVLQSLHKWRPVVTIRELKNSDDEEFRMENVWFIAVTTYYNPEIKSLKVENNKMASGFREDGHHKKTTIRGTKRTASEAHLTPSSSASPQAKMNPSEHFPIVNQFPNQENFEIPKMNPNGHSPIAHHFPNQENFEILKMNPNGHFPIANHFSNPENFELPKMNPNGHPPMAHHFPIPGNYDLATEHLYWLNPYQNGCNYGYNMGQQMPQPVMNQWNMQNMGQSNNMGYAQQGNSNNTFVPEPYGYNNF